jgi:hypothetical protein
VAINELLDVTVVVPGVGAIVPFKGALDVNTRPPAEPLSKTPGAAIVLPSKSATTKLPAVQAVVAPLHVPAVNAALAATPLSTSATLFDPVERVC